MWLIDYILHSVVAQLSLATIAIIGCLVVAYFIPPLRRTMLVVVGAIFSASMFYLKGASDAKRAEKEKSERAVKRVQGKYNEIDARSDDVESVTRKLRDGKF